MIEGFVAVGFGLVASSVTAVEEPLFGVHDLSHVWVLGDLSERELAAARLRQPARVRLVASPEFVGEATVVRSGRILGETDRTLSV